MDALKPCPFCGKVPEIEHISGSYGYYSDKYTIRCCNGIEIHSDGEDYNWEKRQHYRRDDAAKQEITQKWNTRTADKGE